MVTDIGCGPKGRGFDPLKVTFFLHFLWNGGYFAHSLKNTEVYAKDDVFVNDSCTACRLRLTACLQLTFLTQRSRFKVGVVRIY